jgi:hypothetical protein
MTGQTLGILIAGALFAHGLGHSLGFFKPAQSWLLPAKGAPFMRITANVLWSLAGLGFVLAGLAFTGVLVPPDWWRPLAVVFAVVSLLGMVLFGRNWPLFNTLGASGFNLVVLVAILWQQWPAVAMFGR